MTSIIAHLRLPAILAFTPGLTITRALSTTSARFNPKWEGRQPDEHLVNNKDDLNVHSSAAKSGEKDRAGSSVQSSAATEKDPGNQNEKAEKDHPEAPGPVIGMNDERGGVSVLRVVKDSC